MYDKGIFRCDAEGLAKETFCQLGVVSESILQTNVEHGQVTSVQTGSQKVFFFSLMALPISKHTSHTRGKYSCPSEYNCHKYYKVYKPFHELGSSKVSSHGLIVLALHSKRVTVCYPCRSVCALQRGCFTVEGDFGVNHNKFRWQKYCYHYETFSQIYHKNMFAEKYQGLDFCSISTKKFFYLYKRAKGYNT